MRLRRKNFVDSKDKLDALVKENDNISLLINEFKQEFSLLN